MGNEAEIVRLTAALQDDPTGENYVQLAQTLRKAGRFSEAMETLLRGLSELPDHAPARLLLARVFLQLGYRPFAVRELQELRSRFPENRPLERLFEKVAPDYLAGSADSDPSTMASTVAEADFDFDDIALIDDPEPRQ